MLVHYHLTGYSTGVEASERFAGRQQGTSSENLWILSVKGLVSSPVSSVFPDKQVHSSYRYCFVQTIPLNRSPEYLALWIVAAGCENFEIVPWIVAVEMLKVVVPETEKGHVVVTGWKDWFD